MGFESIKKIYSSLGTGIADCDTHREVEMHDKRASHKHQSISQLKLSALSNA